MVPSARSALHHVHILYRTDLRVVSPPPVGLLGSDVVQDIVLGHVILGAAATSDVVFESRRNKFDTANGEIKTYKPRWIRDSSKRWMWVKKADELVVEDVVVVHRISRVILPAGALG